MIEIFLGIIYFLIGTLLGSFCTLAVYRIPLKEDITHKRSFCPNCNHRLEFLDLIPVWSYIFLGGKCRYCKQKIRARYILLELLSGIGFMIFGLSFNISFYNAEISDLIFIVFGMIYLCIFEITAGIDFEKRKFEKGLINFELIVTIIYMLYLCVLGINMYRYIIYFIIIIAVFILSKIKQNYTLDLITYLLLGLVYIGTNSMFFTIIATLIAIALKIIINRLNKKENKYAIGGIFSIFLILSMVIQNYLLI